MNSIVLNKNLKKIEINNTLSSKIIEKKVKKKLLFLQKTKIINGFRRGHIPIKLIKEKFEKNITQEILKEIIYKNFLKEIQKKNIKIYKNVQYFLKKYKKGKNFNYKIQFDSIKNLLQEKLKLIKINKLKIKITNKDVNKVLLNFQKNISNWTTKKTKILENDKINIKFKLISENKKNTIKNDNFVIFVNKNFLFKKIYKKIIGKKKNDLIITHITFSKYHPYKKISLFKKCKLLIKILKVQEKKIQNIDFKKIKNLGIKEKNVQDIKKNIYLQLKKESKKITYENLKNKFIKKWIKICKKKFSNLKKMKVIKNIKKYNLLKWKKNKNIFFKKHNKNIKKESKKILKINYLINKIIKQESLSISNKSIKKIFKQFKQNNYETQKKHKILNKIKKFMLTEQAFNFIFNNIIIKEKRCTFRKAFKKTKNVKL
ncbi:Trigger factor [Buchnera aphidicola (Periphyllus testudinaceus)]|uniref:trigger factor n=1 Tax=Buchnera aphidicola TaxID=9 RepID=UPI00346446BB